MTLMTLAVSTIAALAQLATGDPGAGAAVAGEAICITCWPEPSGT